MATDDFFRTCLGQMIDLRRPLAVLASRMPWPQIESSLAPEDDGGRIKSLSHPNKRQREKSHAGTPTPSG